MNHFWFFIAGMFFGFVAGVVLTSMLANSKQSNEVELKK